MTRKLAIGIVVCGAVLFAVVTTWVSWLRWANFEFRTFDLAFYVQGLWLFLHGKFHVSLLNVPLLGNHVDPIVFALAPLFAIWQHPMALIAAQNVALAAMAPTGYAICRRLGLPPLSAALLGCATLLAPAAGFVALHEFHPEAFAAPLLLLMFHARLRGSLAAYWCFLVAVLSCKENMPLLLASYGCVQAIVDRKSGARHLWRWDFAPVLASLVWFATCAWVIAPALNAGNVDLAALYSRLGASPREIVLHFFTQPWRVLNVLTDSLMRGNLVWALLLPFALLPLLRARWIVIAAPILLQHLLSWRESEWMIYFHYSAPLLPLFWMATAEAVAWFGERPHVSKIPFRPLWSLPVLVLIGCAAGQAIIGPAGRGEPAGVADVLSAKKAISQVPPTASVIAPLPYLSHLAMREHLYSLHHVLKGLNTLSRSEYQPPANSDFVILDASDTATLDRGGGYFHPQMRMGDGRLVPSSERLLHEQMRQTTWVADLRNAVAIYRRGIQASVAVNEPAGLEIAPGTQLISAKAALVEGGLEVQLNWRFSGERSVFPWMELAVFSADGRPLRRIVKGLSAPDAVAEAGLSAETWHCTELDPGRYRLRADFVDHSHRLWSGGGGLASIDLGVIEIPPRNDR